VDLLPHASEIEVGDDLRVLDLETLIAVKGEIRVVAGAESGSVRVRILTKRTSAKNARASFASSGYTIMTLGAWRKWARSAELVYGAR